jgi:hypothetical protein
MQINQYPNESLIFQDNDFYDIDFFNGVGYETKKILGSTIKAGILLAATNIYKNDGALTSNRVLSGNKNTLFFNNLGRFLLESAENNIENVTYNIKNQANFYGFVIRDLSTGTAIFGVKNGRALINNIYYLPGSDGTAGQVMTTDGAGNVNFQNIPAANIPQAQIFVETAIGSIITSLVYNNLSSVILPAGTWLLIVSGEALHNTNNTSVFAGIGIAGIYEPGTGREIRTVNGGASWQDFSSQKVVTIVGLQTASLMAKVSSGSGIIRNRVVTAIKLS